MTKPNQWEVLWSPTNPKKFIKFDTDSSNDICLYEIFKGQDDFSPMINRNQEVVALADNVFVRHVATNSEYNSIKCIVWCPKPELAEHCVLATGLSNGRVAINKIGSDAPRNSGLLLNTVLHPKMERVCNDIDWNTTEHNLIAVALDKVRSDNSLTVWDVEAQSQQQQAGQCIFQHGSGESTFSVKWMPDSPKVLVAGVTKWIRLFDTRAPQSQTPKLIGHTKAIHGICVDPNNSDRIASFAKGQKGGVLVWDIRKPEKPIVTINQTNPVLKVQWCPKRSHLISVLQKDCNAVKYYDLQFGTSLQYKTAGDEESESILFERNVPLPKSMASSISSFDWNPSTDMTLLAVSKTGSLHYLKVFERITMSWSPSSEMMWACGSQMFLLQTPGVDLQDDISFVMKRRAEAGYGESSTMKDDSKLRDVLNDLQLFKLWTWLKRSKKLKEHDHRKIRKFYGVKAIIKGDTAVVHPVHPAVRKQKSFPHDNKQAQKLEDSAPGKRKSLPHEKQASLMEGRSSQTVVEPKMTSLSTSIASQYSSEDRKLALFLCDWDIADDNLKERLDRLQANGEAERAAAMALFHNRLDWTIEILGNGAQSSQKKDLPIVAMALSGYADSRKGSVWVNNCKKLSQQLTNPYLRAMFAFLTAEDEDFTNVLKERDMDLKDRIAFACRYLSDSKLINYVENVTSSLITSGGLEGLLLTGLTTDGIDLLENYITKFGDVQTTILIILFMKFSEVLSDERVNHWIEYYRDLLDRWRLWHKRAQFDAMVQSISTQRKITNQISVTCTYCSKPVSSSMMGSGGFRTGRFNQMPAVGRQCKAMACPNCRQPLPRCSICLINMGSLSSHQPRAVGQKPKLESNVNAFQNWFTWCQMCRHGGHAAHLAEWFAEHVECPITSCTCFCNALDRVVMVTQQESPNNKVVASGT